MHRFGWRLITIFSVPGLTDVGFCDAQTLLALGRHGRHLIDGRTGVRAARDHDERRDWFDPPSRHALGLGPFEQVWIPVAGLGGGALPTTTADGWQAVGTADGVRLHREPAWAGARADAGADTVEITDATDTRAFGFGPDGRLFVHATADGVLVLRRGPRPG